MPEYRVMLEFFEGPLDLLLYLVRRSELDVSDVPLASICREYVEFVDVLEFLEIDHVAEFVSTASTLLEIKSRESLPRPPEEDADDTAEEIEHSNSDLVKRLLEYKKFKDAAALLDDHAARWQQRYPRLTDDRPTERRDASEDRIKNVELWDLVSALGRVVKRQEVDRTSSIRYDDVPISVYIERVSERVQREKRVAFSRFFAGANERRRIIGVFMAVLELLRNHGYRAEQPEEYGEIWIMPPPTG